MAPWPPLNTPLDTRLPIDPDQDLTELDFKGPAPGRADVATRVYYYDVKRLVQFLNHNTFYNFFSTQHSLFFLN